MKRTITAGAALLLGSLISGNAIAEFESINGAELKKLCASFVDIPSGTSDGMCIGYVVGVTSLMEYMDVLCLPVNATHSQATLVAQKYLSDHPETLHVNAEELVIEALQEAFPCNTMQGE